jgi:hypothetical protein
MLTELITKLISCFLEVEELSKLRGCCKLTFSVLPNPVTIPIRIAIHLDVDQSIRNYGYSRNDKCYLYVGWFPKGHELNFGYQKSLRDKLIIKERIILVKVPVTTLRSVWKIPYSAYLLQNIHSKMPASISFINRTRIYALDNHNYEIYRFFKHPTLDHRDAINESEFYNVEYIFGNLYTCRDELYSDKKKYDVRESFET